MVLKKSDSGNISHHEKLMEKLIENTTLLQKKDAELMASVKHLVEKMDRMLNVFEEASKHVMEVSEDKKVAELTDKLEELLEQNKTIAKGLIMLEEYVRKRSPSM
jgi:thiamine biosynthesis lipoprotein ApbE